MIDDYIALFKHLSNLLFAMLNCELCVFSLSCFWQDKILIYSFIIHVFSFLRSQILPVGDFLMI